MRKLNNKGNATVLSVAICLAIILVMCVIFEYMQMLIITTGIRNAVESATVSTVVANYDETYSQLREGYSGGFIYQDTAFIETIDTGNVFLMVLSLRLKQRIFLTLILLFLQNFREWIQVSSIRETHMQILKIGKRRPRTFRIASSRTLRSTPATMQEKHWLVQVHSYKFLAYY